MIFRVAPYMRLELRHKPLRFVDTETTGLDENVHEIIEIAIIDADGDVLLDTKIKPEHLDRASPKALEINGYNEEEWKDAPLFEEVAPEIFKLLSEQCIIAGQNIKFDTGFILASLKRLYRNLGMTQEQVDEKIRKISYHSVDTATLAYEHLAPLGASSMSLWATEMALGISREKQHRALDDIEATRQVFFKLLRMSWWERNKLRLRGLWRWVKLVCWRMAPKK